MNNEHIETLYGGGLIAAALFVIAFVFTVLFLVIYILYANWIVVSKWVIGISLTVVTLYTLGWMGRKIGIVQIEG